jgi:hypothetical protein
VLVAHEVYALNLFNDPRVGGYILFVRSCPEILLNLLCGPNHLFGVVRIVLRVVGLHITGCVGVLIIVADLGGVSRPFVLQRSVWYSNILEGFRTRLF